MCLSKSEKRKTTEKKRQQKCSTNMVKVWLNLFDVIIIMSLCFCHSFQHMHKVRSLPFNTAPQFALRSLPFLRLFSSSSHLSSSLSSSTSTSTSISTSTSTSPPWESLSLNKYFFPAFSSVSAVTEGNQSVVLLDRCFTPGESSPSDGEPSKIIRTISSLELMEQIVLYQDEHIIIAYKPPTINVIKDKNGDIYNLRSMISKYCNCSDLAVIHR